jgi:ketosteroid isomerase-like protein
MDPVTRLKEFYETLDVRRLEHIGDYYADDVRFKDPFNDVRGVEAVRGVLAHMFRQLDRPRFVVRDTLASGPQAFLTWDFLFERRGRTFTIRGASHLRFAADGRVDLHRDYWDAAEELYEKLPVLGALMRWLKKMLAASKPT